MKHHHRMFLAGPLFAIALLGLPACQDDGPLEDAGEEIDDAIDDIGDEIDDAIDG